MIYNLRINFRSGFGISSGVYGLFGLFVCPGRHHALPGPPFEAMAQSWRPYRPIFPSRTPFRRPYRPIFPCRTPFRRPYRPIFPSRTPFWRPYRPIFLSKDHILIEFVLEILDLTCMADLQTSNSTKLRNNFIAGPL